MAQMVFRLAEVIKPGKTGTISISPCQVWDCDECVKTGGTYL